MKKVTKLGPRLPTFCHPSGARGSGIIMTHRCSRVVGLLKVVFYHFCRFTPIRIGPLRHLVVSSYDEVFALTAVM